eukprot:scaffold178221_cov32-Tisochrysis_lutea.AAC.3
MGIGGWKSIRGALKDNLVARSCNATKGAVSIDRSPTTRVVATWAHARRAEGERLRLGPGVQYAHMSCRLSLLLRYPAHHAPKAVFITCLLPPSSSRLATTGTEPRTTMNRSRAEAT